MGRYLLMYWTLDPEKGRDGWELYFYRQWKSKHSLIGGNDPWLCKVKDCS